MQVLSYMLIQNNLPTLLETAWQHTKTSAGVQLQNVDSDPVQHLKTAWQHTKTSAEVELLHVDSHVQKIKNSLVAHQEEGFELHVDSHLTTHETAWQHTKTSAEVELHVDDFMCLAAHQNKCRS